MNLTAVKEDIRAKSLRPIYLFTGEEIGIMNIYINQMAQVTNRKIARVDTFREIFNVLKVSPIVEKSILYVVRDDSDVMEKEEVWKLLSDPKWVGENVLVLAFTSVDKRIKFYKRYKDMFVEFEALDEAVLAKYIKKEIKLKDSNCKKLIEVCENSYSRIMLEIDKMKSYQPTTEDRDGYVDTFDSIFEDFIRNGVIYQPAQDSIFAWSDAVMSRNSVEAFKLMNECFASGEAVLTMVSVLYSNMKHIYQVQTCNNEEIGKSTGLTGWQILCAKKFLRKYKDDELRKAMQLLREMEVGIKTGRIDESLVIEYAMVNIL